MIGMFGGTFNPIHDGHLMLAEQIREEFSLSRVIFVPAFMPPHKINEDILSPEHRLTMLRLAVKNNPGFSVDEIELARTGYSYTVETLQHMIEKEKEPICMIVGADSLVQMHLWRDPQALLRMADIIVARRPETDDVVLHAACEKLHQNFGAKILISRSVAMPHSSTEIRQRLYEGKSVRYMLPDAVLEYIQTHRLYAAGFSG